MHPATTILSGLALLRRRLASFAISEIASKLSLRASRMNEQVLTTTASASRGSAVSVIPDSRMCPMSTSESD